MSTERIRYAVQYPAREGSGEPLLYLTIWTRGALLDVAECWDDKIVAYGGMKEHREPPDSDHLPARVVQVRETITRELVDTPAGLV